MAVFNKFDIFVEDLGDGVHALKAVGDTLEAYLSNATPDAALDALKADLAEIAAGAGYTGPVDVQNDASQAGGVLTVTGVDFTITASGGSVGPFRYVVLFNQTTADKVDPLIGWWDYGSSITLADGESFTTDFAPTGTDELFTVT